MFSFVINHDDAPASLCIGRRPRPHCAPTPSAHNRWGCRLPESFAAPNRKESARFCRRQSPTTGAHRLVFSRCRSMSGHTRFGRWPKVMAASTAIRFAWLFFCPLVFHACSADTKRNHRPRHLDCRINRQAEIPDNRLTPCARVWPNPASAKKFARAHLILL